MLGLCLAQPVQPCVTGVCSGRNTDLVASLGADDVIDYVKSDFIKGDIKYNVIFEGVGNKEFFNCKSVLSPGGIYVTLVPSGKIILLSLLTSVLPGKKCKFISAKPNLQDLSWLKEKIEEDVINVVIDKTYPLEKAREAHEYLETGHARGKVVLIINSRSN
jgi:NADPH:quinone reductase-like Zn-dependent oxidoreductase